MYAQDCERIFLWSTDSKQIVFSCSPNIRRTNECYSQRLGYMSTLTFLLFPHSSFGIRIQMWTRLYTSHASKCWVRLHFFVRFFLHLSLYGRVCATVSTKLAVTQDLFDVPSSVSACRSVHLESFKMSHGIFFVYFFGDSMITLVTLKYIERWRLKRMHLIVDTFPTCGNDDKRISLSLAWHTKNQNRWSNER